MTSNTLPLDQYVVIKKYTKPQTDGALILTAKSEPKNIGIIEAVGVNVESDLRGGQLVQFLPNMVQPLAYTDDRFLIKSEFILAILENE